MHTPSCPNDVKDPICRRIAAEVADEIEGSTFTQSYRLDAILEPLIGNAINIPSSYIARIPLRRGTWGTRLYLALYDVAEYVLYHVIYSGSKRVNKDEVYFKKKARHHVSAVKLGPESCDLLSYGKIEAEENQQINRVVRTYWLIGQAFNRPIIRDKQLCGPTASYLRILDERDGVFHTYSIAIANISPYVSSEKVKPRLPLSLGRVNRHAYSAQARLITYDPATGKLESAITSFTYVQACPRRGAVPGPHLLIYGPALGDQAIAVPLKCTCAGAPSEYCSRSLYYHVPLLVLALLVEERNVRTIYSKLLRKAYRIMEPGEARHLSYNAVLNLLATELGEEYKILGIPIRLLFHNPGVAERHALRKGEKLLQKSLNENYRLVL